MQEAPVNVFWDIENCAVPSNMKGVQVVNAIRSFCLQRGILKNISAFANLKLIKDDLRGDLQESGVLLHDVTRKNNSSDLAILVELLKLVIDNKPPHCIVLISGDRDFANVLSHLTNRKYLVYLIHSPQASEVLKHAATESFEWTTLLKRGGDTSTITSSPAPSSSIPLPAPYEKFAPLVDFLVQKNKPQVEFSELGNLIPFAKYDYKKLKDYVFDAQNAGLVKCGANKNIHWVALNGFMNGDSVLHLNGFPSNTTTSSFASPSSAIPCPTFDRPPTDRRLVLKHLQAALDSLKKDYFKPTESTVQKRIKQMALPLVRIEWEELLSIAKSQSFIVEGEKPNRWIFPPQGQYEGVDPSHPIDKYSPTLWKNLVQFLVSVHPVVRIGRYGFAQFLKDEGPPELRELPLGPITEIVQLSLHRNLLKYHKTQVSTILPTDPQDEPELPARDNYNHINININHPISAYSPFEDIRDGPIPQWPGDVFPFPGFEDGELIGVTFVWPYFGTSVLVTGSFFNWRNTTALHRRNNQPMPPFGSLNTLGSGEEMDDVFSSVLYLPPGKYEYKFIVDGAWHYDPKLPVVTDETGNLNNLLVVEPLDLNDSYR